MVGINEINEILNDFLKDFELTADIGEDFGYYYNEDRIEYALVMPTDSVDYFMINFNKLAPDLHCDPFLASFLHEVGHARTDHLFEIEEEEKIWLIKEKMHQEYCISDNSMSEERNRELHMEYFNLPDEYEATMWAIKYMREHTDKITNLWNKLHYAIVNFYLNNGVDIHGC